MKKQAPQYEIKTVLDFLKVPEARLPHCLAEFTDFLAICRKAEANQLPLTAVEWFVWRDDSKHNINIKIIAEGTK